MIKSQQAEQDGTGLGPQSTVGAGQSPSPVHPAGFDVALAKRCAEISARAYIECTINEPAFSTQVLFEDWNGVTVVAFRGSKELRDWITDAECSQANLLSGGAKIHSGIFAAFNHVRDQINERLGSNKVIFTGHSLGGALAQLAAWTFEQSIDAKVYTFGQPRLGDHNFARQYDLTLWAQTFRFVHEEDIVPRLPVPCATPFHGGYRHAGQEIFLASDGRVYENPPLIAKLISDVRGIWHGYLSDGKLGILDVITDHFMQGYLERINQLA